MSESIVVGFVICFGWVLFEFLGEIISNWYERREYEWRKSINRKGVAKGNER